MLRYSSQYDTLSDHTTASTTATQTLPITDAANRILYSSEKLLSDPKQTAAALLAVKYGIFESSDANLSYNLMALAKLLAEYPSTWTVVDQSLTDKVRLSPHLLFADF